MTMYSVLAFDPGLTTLGYSFSVYDTSKEKMTVQKFGTYKPTKSANKEKEKSNIYGTRLIALNLLEEEVKRLIDTYKPNYIASEDVFLHVKHVNAFAALTLCVNALKQAAYSRNMVIHTLAPCDIKKETSGSGHADKDAIQKAILNNSFIKIIDNKAWPISKMCEHEADSIAVGYSFFKSVLPNLILTANMSKISTVEELDVNILHKKKRRLSKAEKEALEQTEIGIQPETDTPVDVFAEYEKKISKDTKQKAIPKLEKVQTQSTNTSKKKSGIKRQKSEIGETIAKELKKKK